jgi:PAS domain S-box-containing protein
MLLTHIAMKLPGRLNAALRTSEERLQDIIDNATAVIFVKDLDLHYLLVNSEFERRHQVQPDQFRGKTDFDIHPYEVAEAVRAKFAGDYSPIRMEALADHHRRSATENHDSVS